MRTFAFVLFMPTPRDDSPHARDDLNQGLLAKISDWLPRLYGPLLAALCLGMGWRALSGGADFWAHAAVGRWIINQGSIPQHTLFLWSEKQEWIAHSWLSQASFYALMQSAGPHWGPVFAVLLAGAVTVVTVALLWRAWQAHGRITVLTPIFFALALWCGSPRIRPRPELWSGLFFAIVLIFLLDYEKDKKITPRALLGLVLMFVLWTNFHGGVAMGLLLIAVTACADILQDRLQGGWRNGHWRYSPLLALLVCCALAVLVNPYGPRYLVALLPVGGEMFSYIDEWKPMWKYPAMDEVFIGACALLGVFSFLTWLSNEKGRWSQAAWLMVWGVLLLTARRHMWLWALVCLAVLSANSSFLDWRTFGQKTKGATKEARRAAPLHWVVLARLAMVIFLIAGCAQQTPQNVVRDWPPRATSRYLPVQASQKLKQIAQTQKVRLFNDYEFSSYLQWHLAGTPPLFIDLLNAYPDQLLLDYFEMIKATPRGLKLLRERKINTVFLRRHKEKGKRKEALSKLAAYLNKQKQWRRVYKGRDGTIWLKNS